MNYPTAKDYTILQIEIIIKKGPREVLSYFIFAI